MRSLLDSAMNKEFLDYINYRYESIYQDRNDPVIKHRFIENPYGDYLEFDILIGNIRKYYQIAIPRKDNLNPEMNTNKTFNEKLTDFTNSLSNEELVKFISLIKKNEK